MGSIFKPQTTVVQAPSQQTTSYDIPQYFKDIQERTLKKAENLGQRPYQAYTGQMIAPLSALEQQSANVATQQLLPQTQQLRAIGEQRFTPTVAQQYMNPYESQVIKGAIGDVEEQYQQAQRALSATAVGAGAFGGTRFGVERALGTERFLDQVGDISSRLRQAGFESGAARFAADRASQLQAAQAQLSGTAGAIQGLSTLGATSRGIEQAGLAEAYRDFIERREYPVEQVRQVVGALAGAPIRTYGEERSGTVGTPVGAPSIFGQIVGGAQALGSFMSDIRLKDDIKLIGQSPSGINIYSFRYKGDDTRYQGVLAHQVPHASIVNDKGYLMVDYSKIDVNFKELN
jgi:hypothetical protein